MSLGIKVPYCMSDDDGANDILSQPRLTKATGARHW